MVVANLLSRPNARPNAKGMCLLEIYGILSVTIENICKQIIPTTKFAIQLAIANLCKFVNMID